MAPAPALAALWISVAAPFVAPARLAAGEAPVVDASFFVELEPVMKGHLGLVELKGWAVLPAPIRGLSLRLRLGAGLVAQVTADVPEPIKKADRSVTVRFEEDVAEVGIVYSTGEAYSPPVGDRVHAFTLKLCIRLPTPVAGWDLPAALEEVSFQPQEGPPVVGAGSVPPAIRVTWGISHTMNLCLDVPPSPDFLACETLPDGKVLLTWTNPVEYQSIVVSGGTGPGRTIELPGDATSWLDEEGGASNNYVYLVRASTGDGRWSDIIECAATDPRPAVPFVRGDTNADGAFSIADLLAIREWLFGGDAPPACVDTADIDDDGDVNIVDEFDVARCLFRMDLVSEPPTAPMLRPAAPFPLPGVDPTHEGETTYMTCESYEVEPAVPADDAIGLGEVQAVPGGEVEIPIYLTNATEVDAVQLVVRYDPTILRVESGGETLVYGGTWFEPLIEQHTFYTKGGHFTWDKPHVSQVDAYPEEGVFTAGIVGSLLFRGYFEIPPGERTPIAKVRATVSADVPPGSIVTLAPWNGPDDQGFGEFRMRNELTYRGAGRYATLLPSTFDGILRIGVEDVSFFIRGNANGDATLDVADPIAVVNHLFLGAEGPRCPDAADADDSGEIELTDAIVILSHLFLGTGDLPAPYPDAGPDPNPDFLGKCRG